MKVEVLLFDESIYPVFDAGLDAANLDEALTALEKLDPTQGARTWNSAFSTA